MRLCARSLASALIAVVCVAVLAGCSQNSPNGNLAHIRTIDAVPNGGQATIFVNEGTATGTQSFFHASPYLFIGSGAAGFQFSLSAQPSITYTAANQTISNGGIYSVVATGRADITDEIDARYPRLIFLQDSTGSVPANSAALRLVNVAPDSPDVNLVVNGASEATNISYLHNSDYIAVPAGRPTLEVESSGTSTALAGPTAVTLSAGQHYTLYFVEPDVTTPTFGMQVLSDHP